MVFRFVFEFYLILNFIFMIILILLFYVAFRSYI